MTDTKQTQGLEIDSLNTYYGKAHVLHDVSLRVGPGERVAILGRNGMGKTTLLKSIMNIGQVKTQGSIRYGGEELTRMAAYQVARQGIGYVPQGWQLFRSLSVEEHLLMAYRKGGPGEWTPGRVLDIFPEIARRRKVGGTRLSGGEQQILAIGRALVTNSSLLLMDEPSEGVSAMVLQRVDAICQDLSQGGKSILLVEQNLSLALTIAQRLYILVNGSVVHAASSPEFREDREKQAMYLGI
ncbi:MAG: ABC transporter ATP-binding protein [Candidatus Limiplasma sp.]|nr:ABC transporter ATP-binding protein [Candidatus Limiplasma sp.]